MENVQEEGEGRRRRRRRNGTGGVEDKDAGA